jgi:hypothetical protein
MGHRGECRRAEEQNDVMVKKFAEAGKKGEGDFADGPAIRGL